MPTRLPVDLLSRDFPSDDTLARHYDRVIRDIHERPPVEGVIPYARPLLDAAYIVDLVAGLMNEKTHACSSCALKKAENWREAQLAKELRAVTDKLTKIAKMMDRPA